MLTIANTKCYIAPLYLDLVKSAPTQISKQYSLSNVDDSHFLENMYFPHHQTLKKDSTLQNDAFLDKAVLRVFIQSARFSVKLPSQKEINTSAGNILLDDQEINGSFTLNEDEATHKEMQEYCKKNNIEIIVRELPLTPSVKGENKTYWYHFRIKR